MWISAASASSRRTLPRRRNSPERPRTQAELRQHHRRPLGRHESLSQVVGRPVRKDQLVHPKLLPALQIVRPRDQLVPDQTIGRHRASLDVPQGTDARGLGRSRPREGLHVRDRHLRERAPDDEHGLGGIGGLDLARLGEHDEVPHAARQLEVRGGVHAHSQARESGRGLGSGPGRREHRLLDRQAERGRSLGEGAHDHDALLLVPGHQHPLEELHPRGALADVQEQRALAVRAHRLGGEERHAAGGQVLPGHAAAHFRGRAGKLGDHDRGRLGAVLEAGKALHEGEPGWGIYLYLRSGDGHGSGRDGARQKKQGQEHEGSYPAARIHPGEAEHATCRGVKVWGTIRRASPEPRHEGPKPGRRPMIARLLPCLALLPLLILLAPRDSAAANETLAKLCDEFWQGELKASPTTATSIGDKRYYDRLYDITPKRIAQDLKRLEGVLKRTQAITVASLDPEDRLTRTALLTEVQDQLAALSCEFEEWTVDPLGGPQNEFMNLYQYTNIETPMDGENYVKRTKLMGPYLDDTIANLRVGKAQGKVAARDAVTKTLAQLTSLNATPVEKLGIWQPALAAHPGWSDADRKHFVDGLADAIHTSLVPGLERYRAFLEKEILPKARSQEKAGLASLPGGVEGYKRMIRVHTSLDMPPEEIHALGLHEDV